MKSKVITGLVLALFSASMLTLAFNITPVKASSTIIVPDQYEKIQWAIGNATAGDTIFIRTGTYYENVVVEKRVSLVGENKYNTIVDGGGIGTVIKILVDNVEVTGLTIRNSGDGGHQWFNYTQQCGILVSGRGEYAGQPVGYGISRSSRSIIKGNIITNSVQGIYLEWSDYNIVSGNNISNNKDKGLRLRECEGTIVDSNVVSNNQDGIYLVARWQNILNNNTVFSNRMSGIYLGSTKDNIVINNVALDNKYGIYVKNGWIPPENNKLIDNTVSFNTEVGIYGVEVKEGSISGNNASSNIGIGIKLSGNGVYVYDNNVSNNGLDGIRLGGDNNILSGNTVSNNIGDGIGLSGKSNILSGNTISNNGQDGIDLDGQNNILSGNTVSNNTGDGIHLSGSYNKLFGNTLSHNTYNGIWLWDFDDGILSDNIIVNNEDNGIYLANSDNNILFGNTVSSNNGAGIVVLGTIDNRIFHNEFNSNAKSVNSTGSIDSWDNNGEGNYWSDYDGKDLDRNGIGDKPYIIDKNNRDNYPLMGKFSNFSISWEYETYHVTTICDSTISDFQYDGVHKRIRFNVTGPDGTAGFCRVTVPMNLLKANATHPWKVLVDNIEMNYTKAEKGNHTLIYFTYTHSTHKVQITVEKLPPPFWMQWWFWAIAAVVIVALTGTIYFLMKKKPPISED